MNGQTTVKKTTMALWRQILVAILPTIILIAIKDANISVLGYSHFFIVVGAIVALIAKCFVADVENTKDTFKVGCCMLICALPSVNGIISMILTLRDFIYIGTEYYLLMVLKTFCNVMIVACAVNFLLNSKNAKNDRKNVRKFGALACLASFALIIFAIVMRQPGTVYWSFCVMFTAMSFNALDDWLLGNDKNGTFWLTIYIPILLSVLIILFSYGIFSGGGYSSSSSDYDYDYDYDSDYSYSSGSSSSSSYSYSSGSSYSSGRTCAKSGCSRKAVTSGDSIYCSTHSNRCLSCGCYIDGDAMYCMDCIYDAFY